MDRDRDPGCDTREINLFPTRRLSNNAPSLPPLLLFERLNYARVNRLYVVVRDEKGEEKSTVG